MSVEVRVPAMMRAHVGDQKTVTADGATVGDVLKDIERQFQGFSGNVFESDGELRKFVNIYLNDEDIRYLGRLEAPVSAGDVLSILPAVAGGAA
ncbi:MAG: ubiquitin-like small modifier protein 1 [Chloroflexota bacterium]